MSLRPNPAAPLPAEHVRIADALQTDVHVLARLRREHFLVVDRDALHLRLSAVRHQQHRVPHDLCITAGIRVYQATGLDLSGDDAAAVVEFVQNGETKRSGGVSSLDLHRVQDFEERRAGIPGTHAFRNAVLQIVAAQTRHREEGHVLLHVVPHSLQIGRQLRYDVVISTLRPLHRLFVHLVHRH